MLYEDFFYVCTAQFNQGCVDNFFALIRSKEVGMTEQQLPFENQASTNEQVIFKQPSALLKKKLEPCVLPNDSSDLVFSHSVKEV